MDLNLTGKSVLVTGAGRGIGRAIALELAKEKTKVFVTSRTESDIASLVQDMGGISKGHAGLAMDLCASGGPQTLVNHLDKSFGVPDIIVHNLGDTLNVKDPFCSMADWDRVWRINIGVGIELNQILLPRLKEKKWGRVVNIASTASLENNGPVTYCTAKAALVAYTRCMGRILAPDGIVMSAVIVGAIFTEGGYWDQVKETNPQHMQKYIDDRLPLKRFGKPEDIANMVAFLSSDRADFCQGAIVPVEGAQSRHYFSMFN